MKKSAEGDRSGDGISAALLGRLRSGLSERYAVEKVLGKGGMAAVFLARDIKHGRRVAIKVLLPELGNSIASERFLREVRTTAQLNHPHILALFDSGEVDGLLFYVMPFVPGESLAERIARQGPLPVDDAVLIARQVLDGLEHAHAQGIVHRDVKPGNIMLVGDTQAWVADFGLSRALHAATSRDLTHTGTVIGSPLYMSPEQIGGSRIVDGRSDIYGFGCVLYEMLSGAAPFASHSYQEVLTSHLFQSPTPLGKVRPSVPPHVERAVDRALAKDPAERYPTAGAFAVAISSPEISSTNHRGESSPSSGGVRRRKVWAAAIAAGFALVAAAIVLSGTLRTGSEAPAGLVTVVVLPASLATGSTAADSAAGLTHAMARAVEIAPGLRVRDGSSLLQEGRNWRSYSIEALVAGAREMGAQYLIATEIVPNVAPPVTVDVFDLRTGQRIHHGLGGASGEPASIAIQRLGLDAVRAIAATAGLSLGSVDRIITAGQSPTAIAAVLEGRRLLWAEQTDAAITSFHRAIASDSSFAPAYFYLSAAQLAAPYWDSDASLATLEKGLRQGASMPARWGALLEAQRQYVLRSGSTAIQAFHQLTGDDPGFPEAWLGLGESHFHLSGYLGLGPASALPAFSRLAELDSTFSPGVVRSHLVDAAIWGDDPQNALRHVALIPSQGDQLARNAVIALKFGTPAEGRTAIQVLSSADLRTVAQAAYLTANRPDLLEKVAGTLTGPTRPASDRRVGSRFRFAALAAMGHWEDAVGSWRDQQLPSALDPWMALAYLAGYPAESHAAPMFAHAAALLADSIPIDFTQEESPHTLAFRALAHRALLDGDSTTTISLLQALRGFRSGPSDPEPEALRATLDSRLALLAGDTTRTIALLKQSLHRTPWSLADYYQPLEDAGIQRVMLARLLKARGETTEARRWASSFGNTLAVSDIFFIPEATSLLRSIASSR